MYFYIFSKIADCKIWFLTKGFICKAHEHVISIYGGVLVFGIGPFVIIHFNAIV